MASNNIHIHLDGSPFLTPERFADLSGIPLKAVQKRIQRGEFPVESFNLEDSATSRAKKYINMVKLAEMAASSPFVHPRLSR
ncbi:hypothetical protein GCM10011403_29520 [Pseudohongiella nitratireducens]|uniref:Uncharacterized protein n=2 Tax=Pseudohongiella nitratireducens TaxID=1768907 RepID=A0A916QNA9_9GAMM|nr:hypothetical protein GCM10011403_29520 [Pseudohongiella nitratireducens]